MGFLKHLQTFLVYYISLRIRGTVGVILELILADAIKNLPMCVCKLWFGKGISLQF